LLNLSVLQGICKHLLRQISNNSHAFLGAGVLPSYPHEVENFAEIQ